jgi:hypothetical protein
MQNKSQQPSRRNFIKQLTGTTLALGAGSIAAFAAGKKQKNASSNMKKRSPQMTGSISP